MTPIYVPYEKASYLAPTGDAHHLFAVMNDPCSQHQCLVINVTSIKPGRAYDTTCMLDVGDHPFIKHPSYVLYRMAETIHKAKIGKHIDAGYYLTRDDWHPDVFARIAAGIHASDETILRIVRYAELNAI